jgi:hypothetical protein
LCAVVSSLHITTVYAHGGDEKCVTNFVGKPEGKRRLGRPRRRWEDNIKMDLKSVGFGTWIGFIWLRTDRWRAVVNTVMKF